MQTSLLIDFPNLRGNEKVGDPCPCGCGGVKILPHNPNVRKLSISSPCQTCGKGRIYEAGENSAGFVYGPHSPLCHPCSQLERILYRKGASAESPFQIALREVLKRKEVTLKQACATAGIRERTVLSWIRGDFVPRRDSLEQLAAVLDAPALIATITSRIGRITVTCPDCGKVRSYKSSNLKREIERYNRPEVGWEKWTPKSDKLERRRCQEEEGPGRKVYQGIPAGSSEAGIGRESVIARGRGSVVLTAIDVGVLGEAV